MPIELKRNIARLFNLLSQHVFQGNPISTTIHSARWDITEKSWHYSGQDTRRKSLKYAHRLGRFHLYVILPRNCKFKDIQPAFLRYCAIRMRSLLQYVNRPGLFSLYITPEPADLNLSVSTQMFSNHMLRRWRCRNKRSQLILQTVSLLITRKFLIKVIQPSTVPSDDFYVPNDVALIVTARDMLPSTKVLLSHASRLGGYSSYSHWRAATRAESPIPRFLWNKIVYSGAHIEFKLWPRQCHTVMRGEDSSHNCWHFSSLDLICLFISPVYLFCFEAPERITFQFSVCS